jgi:DNA-binding NtrC family response regulator
MSAPYPRYPVLLVDDEQQVLSSVGFSMKLAGIDCISCQDSRRVAALLREQPVSVVVLDLLMPHISGYDLLPEIKRLAPDSPVIVMTAVNEVESAVGCMKKGAYDYLLKPVGREQLIATVRKALEHWEMATEMARLKEYVLTDKFERPEAFEHIITRSDAMRSLFRYIEAISATPMPILVTGESGTGKELIATSIHKASGREGELVAVNVAGLEDNLFSDTLFGHERGAFTGATTAREGLLSKAAGGTIFLDEIGDLARESQIKLLRLLEDRTYYPVGSDTPIKTDARIVAATNRSIDDLLNSETFRSDLYYRLRTHHIHVPPLRERREDIPLLVDHFIETAAKEMGKAAPTPPPEIYHHLGLCDFPGNVRELKSVIYDAVGRHRKGVLSLQPIKERLFAGGRPAACAPAGTRAPEGDGESPVRFSSRLPTMKEVGELLIQEALTRANGNQSLAAQLIGMTRSALNKRLHQSRD